MPCDLITTVGIEVGKMPPDLLHRALVADGISATISGQIVRWQGHAYDATTGTLTVRGSNTVDKDSEIATVKQSYSRQIIREQARKNAEG